MAAGVAQDYARGLARDLRGAHSGGLTRNESRTGGPAVIRRAHRDAGEIHVGEGIARAYPMARGVVEGDSDSDVLFRLSDGPTVLR